MPSLSPKERASLCRFTLPDGRRYRSPRSNNRSNLCPITPAKKPNP